MKDRFTNSIGYKRTLDRGSELSYWITLDRRREKALRELERQKQASKTNKKGGTNGRKQTRRAESSRNEQT